MPGWARGFSPGTPPSSHINDPIAQTSVPTKDINMTCTTCLSVVVKYIKFSENSINCHAKFNIFLIVIELDIA